MKTNNQNILELLIKIKRQKPEIELLSIFEEIVEMKNKYADFTDLELVYHFLIEKQLKLFEHWARRIAKSNGSCVECSRGFEKGDIVEEEFTLSLIRHIDCNYDPILNEKLLALKQFEKGDNEGANLILDKIRVLDFGNLFKNPYTPELLLLVKNPIFLKSFKMNIKKLPQSKLNAIEFIKPCNKIFLETAKQFGIDTTEDDLNRLLRSDDTINNEYRLFQIDFYNLYFKTEAFTVTHDTTENIKKFKTVFEKLIRTSDDGKVRIIDRYVDGYLIENFIQHLPLEGLNHLEILASIKGMEKLEDYERLTQKANEFKEKLLSRINIKLEIKIYLSDFGSETLHHRTIQNNSIVYSVADGIREIFRGQPLGYVQQLDEKLVEASKPVWDEKWKAAADVYEHPETIKEKILMLSRKDQQPREMHDAKCGDCGTDCQVPFQPKQDRPVYCRECFENHR